MDMKKLLAATAIAALIAGPNLAVAQGTTTSSPTGAGKGGPAPSAAGVPGGARDDAGTPAAGDKVPHQRTGQSDVKKGAGESHKNAQKSEPGRANPSHAGDMKKGSEDARRSGSDDADAAKKSAADAQKSGTQRGDEHRASGNRKGQHAGPAAGNEKKSTTGVGGSGTLTAEKRTRIKQTIIKSGNAARVKNVNFSISVGTSVPRSVTLVAVPSTVIEIYPAWRGYEYFIVGGEIVIVNPNTMRIIAVIPA